MYIHDVHSRHFIWGHGKPRHPTYPCEVIIQFVKLNQLYIMLLELLSRQRLVALQLFPVFKNETFKNSGLDMVLKSPLL
jgi:hypothetical protein